jgi:hypothetical protein
MSLEVLEINNLTYEEPESVSVIEKTVRNQIFANPNTYNELTGGEVLPILINSGAEYVDASRSTLTFQVRINVADGSQAAHYRFDKQSVEALNSGATVLNLISQVQLESKDGQLIFRENFKNIMQTTREYKLNQEAKNQLSMCGGYQAMINDYPAYPVNKFTSFTLPLSLIAPFFNTASMIPAQLIAGSVLRLQINNPTASVLLYNSNDDAQITDGQSVTLDISGLSLYLQESKLLDGVDAVLKHSAMKMNKGLSFPYYQNFNTVYVPTSSSFNFDIQLSASKASYVVIKFLSNDAGKGTLSPIGCATIKELNADTNLSDPNALGFSVQCRLGQMVMPLFPIVSAVEAYKLTCDALNPISYSNCEDIDVLKNKNKLMSGCVAYNYYNFSQIFPGNPVVSTGLGLGGTMFAFNLERSSGVNLGGLATNASRVLSIEVNGMSGYAGYKLYASVQYLSVASIYENNVVISK